MGYRVHTSRVVVRRPSQGAAHGAQHMVHSTWCMVRGAWYTWCMVYMVHGMHGTWYVVQGAWYLWCMVCMVHGIHGAWYTWCRVHGGMNLPDLS